MAKVYEETHLRSIIKALSYRLAGLAITVGVAYLLTRRMQVAAAIGLADTAVKIVAYYLHERAWLRINLGRREAPEYQI